jgi:hypothetical protein
MVPLAARPSGFDDTVEQDETEEIEESRESGTRRVARRASSPPEALERASKIPSPRESQRPTLPAPSAASLASYVAYPPHIQQIAIDAGHVPRIAIHMQSVGGGQVSDRPTLIPARGVYHEERTAAIEATVPAGAASRPQTLRLRLTPFAREHASADGDTDDTPGALLEYLKVFGSLDRIPVVTATMRDILMTDLDHREGFMLSLIDGKSDIDTLLDASPMPTHKVLRILQGLRARGLVSLRDAPKEP